MEEKDSRAKQRTGEMIVLNREQRDRLHFQQNIWVMRIRAV